jgi:hypothetical protein
MGVRERLEILYKLLGFEHLSEFAEAVGVKPGTAQQQANRGRIPYDTARRYVDKAKGTGATVEWLREGKGEPPSASHDAAKSLILHTERQIDEPPPAIPLSPNDHVPFAGEAKGPYNPPVLGAHDLLIYELMDLGGGIAMLSRAPVKTAPRPDDVRGILGAFGVYIATDQMEPAYLLGDFLCISPAPPARPDRDVLLMTGRPGEADVKTALRRLVSITETHWVCKQHNPAKTERFSRATWPLAYRVILRVVSP